MLSMMMKRLSLKHPLIVAPMAGGPSTPELVVASCEAGALGSIGAAYLSAQQIDETVSEIRARTTKPFAVNLFAPHPLPLVREAQIKRAIESTAAFRKELNLPTPQVKPPFEEDFSEQFEAVLRARPAVLSWVFGHLPNESIREAKKARILLVGTATSPDEAKELEADCDAIVLQGFEAGGHRALFSADARDPEILLSELLRSVRLKIPVVAAGGIMNRDDIRRALEAGASLVQMGTAFLNCHEAGTAPAYRERLRSPRETRTSRAYSGRLARGIVNRFMREMPLEAVMPFPQQNKFTRDLRKAGGADFMSLWSGSGQGELWSGSCGDLIEALFS